MKNIKHTILIAAMLSAAFGAAASSQAKYVFYFIGDGMGLNQVQLAELYGAETDGGRIGREPLLMTGFPVVSVGSTFSESNGVTDSAASGTALASGVKTANGCIGVAADKKTPLKSIAHRAKEAGRRVGISSSVAINHATPAAFYAHNKSRKNYNAIGRDLPASGFDFFGGSDFWGVPPADSAGLFNEARRAGYTIVRGYDAYKKAASSASRMILFQDSEASAVDSRTTPYAIDRRSGDLSLAQIVSAGIDFLAKDAPNGFFFMIEGGNIDWECHSNDAAAVAAEVRDFDSAIAVAYDFYRQHPDETLIVVTADHETGSLCLGTGSYDLNLRALASQKVSEVQFSRMLNDAHRRGGGNFSWDDARRMLADNFGFWEEIELTPEQEESLRAAFTRSYGKERQSTQSEYQKDVPLASEAKRILDSIALVGWGSGGHSASFVPVFAIGSGAENFKALNDNAQIARRIARIGGYPVEN